jgi:hypothetical protein
MAITTRLIFDRLSQLEKAAKNLVQEDEQEWIAAEIEKLEQLRRDYFDKWRGYNDTGMVK